MIPEKIQHLVRACALVFATSTLGADIVINEVHYDAEPSTIRSEFVELYNSSNTSVDLSGWQFTDGVTFVFPEGSTLGPDQYLIVVEDVGTYDSQFPIGAPPGDGGAYVAGQYEGGLSNEGEQLELIDTGGNVVDSVDYGIGFPWPLASRTDGVSMELINPAFDNDLSGSWRSAAAPTPGRRNTVYADNAPPLIRQVEHSPKRPVANEPTLITAKVTDTDGVASVVLQYQEVRPGHYIPAYNAKSTPQLLSNPNAPRSKNPEYEGSVFAGETWIEVAMVDDGTNGDEVAGDSIYSVTLQGFPNRHLIRYRITIADTLGAEVRVPYEDDPVLNFAYFVYNGVPEYVASARSVHPEGAGHVYPKEVMTSLPVYMILVSPEDFEQAVAYNSSNQIPSGNDDARRAFNWNCTLVYGDEVYDNIRFRLRQLGGRYAGTGKRSFRFKFNAGDRPQLHDLYGNEYPERWRSMNLSKMTGSAGGAHWGLAEAAGEQVFNLYGVAASQMHWVHMRVIDGPDEAPEGQNGQYLGDFYGMFLAQEPVDQVFLDAHDLPRGNIYKLKSSIISPDVAIRYQARDAVSDGSDFTNIRNNLRPERNEEWLRSHVDYPHWYRYHTVVEAIRHHDFRPDTAGWFKNRYWYFKPSEDPLGQMATIPWDWDTSWGPNWNYGEDFPKQAIFGYWDEGSRSFTDQSGAKPEMITEYRNAVREFRDLVWQEDQINPLLDHLASLIKDFVPADRDRWRGAPAMAGRQDDGPMEPKLQDMRNFAFVGGSWFDDPGGGPGASITASSGRDAYLDQLSQEKRPTKPSVTYEGSEGYPVDDLRFSSSEYRSSIFEPVEYQAMEWRIAEVDLPGVPRPPEVRPKFEINAAWESGPSEEFLQEITIPSTAVRAGDAYRVRVRHQSVNGSWSNWSDPVEFVASEPENLDDHRTSLVVSEVMYHPTDPSQEEIAAGFLDDGDFEYLELYNRGQKTLDLTHIRFTKGIDFDFATGGTLDIEPGAYVLVVKNRAAFEMRYGTGLPVIGEWDENDQLSNAGEQLKLSFGGGTPLIDFTYDDDTPWPAEADGDGHSFVPGDPQTLLAEDYGMPGNWRASAMVNGSPGSPDSTPSGGIDAWLKAHFSDAELLDDAVSGDLADPDGDGLANLAEYAFGADPRSREFDAMPVASAVLADGSGSQASFLALTYTARDDADDVDIVVEVSSDFFIWESGDGVFTEPVGSAVSNGDGTSTHTVRDMAPMDESPTGRRFMRVSVSRK